MLEKGGFCLKTGNYIQLSSMWISVLLWFKPKGGGEESKNRIRLPHAKVSDLGEEEPRSTRASESHSWTGRDVTRFKSKRSSGVHQRFRKCSSILWGLWERTHGEMISETSGAGGRVGAVGLSSGVHISLPVLSWKVAWLPVASLSASAVQIIGEQERSAVGGV